MQTTTQTAAEKTAERFSTLTEDELIDLHSDDGLQLDIDGTEVTVWHREDDDRIVAFTNPNYPEEGEEWHEVDAPARRHDVKVTELDTPRRRKNHVFPMTHRVVCDTCGWGTETHGHGVGVEVAKRHAN